ncbi:SDR family NAD(P)-dependent oxidoreductase [Nocardioides bruguierae]|uniref:3-oxoacyl-ACP reductase FabG n=1 Tax=Nocardioides bruguierae TaxID=2945102 RepID=A0A9X2IEN4_9ACTN|nr:3-oxoacyl-ACP reductase FabG [Nocardioides bruguierae]MCL8025625.1 3-oxoacyl-ACP reductase FabG [Nocardioides bruguierae]MCM0620482.1 3-oxoacyl-ACP reductase FabG [Nocardioides bruguierae]
MTDQSTPTEATYEGRYAGRSVLVTGAARGIGLATATRFAREGASVAIVDLDAGEAERAAASLPLVEGASAVGLACDVADTAAAAAAVQGAVDALGGLHVLVNNAGVTRDNLLFKMSEADWDTVIGVHLRGAFAMSQAAQKVFVPQAYGRIVNLSSTSALGNRGQANYSAAKMGLQGFTRTLALELGPYGITCNAVAPGFVVTEMTDATAARLKMDVGEFRRRSAELTAVKRIGQPSDIAQAITYLASEDASFVTGQTLYVDGGMTLG